MVRVSSSTTSRRRKKKVLKQTKGQFGKRSKHIRQAKRSLIKGLSYQYRDRKVNKRKFRSLWIIRLNAACREEGVTYSRFIKGLKEANIEIDRKLLADLCISSPAAFKKLLEVSQNSAKE